MTRRPITRAEIEAGKTPKGGWTYTQLRLWGVRCPPPAGWRKRLLQNGVPINCPMPDGFVAPDARQQCRRGNPLLRFGPQPAPIVLPPDAIEIFTDGSCDPNPGPGGWAFAVYRGIEEVHSACGGDALTTNNRMELQALIETLRWLDPARAALIWSDSQYVVNGCLTWRHGWKRRNWTRGKAALANADLWDELDALLDARAVDVRWTRGHVGTAGNERADELADQGRLMVSGRAV